MAACKHGSGESGEDVPDMMENPLFLEACDRSDRGTQRCRMSPQQMESRGLTLGSCVRVDGPESSYVCNVWPRDDGHEDAVKCDITTCIPRCASPGEDALRENRPNFRERREKFCTVQKVIVKKVSRLSVAVVFTEVSEVKRYKSCVKEGTNLTHLGPLKKSVLDIVRKYYVTDNMCVDCTSLRIGKLYGIAHFKISNVDTGDADIKYGKVSSQTKVQITDVMSYRKYSMKSSGQEVLCAGCDLQVQILTGFLNLPILYTKAGGGDLGINWPHGILIQGPSGTGKTSLVIKVVHDLDLIVLTTNGTEVFGERPGEGEEKLRKLFGKAVDLSDEAPCVILIEDLEAMCPRRTASGGRSAPERRMVAQLARLMDELTNEVNVLVVGTTSQPQMVDPVLRRPGRFEKEVLLGVPTVVQRRQMLELLLRGKPCVDVDATSLADSTPGFVAADLKALVSQAHYQAVITTNTTNLTSPEGITMDHFNCALHEVVPSTQRGSDVLVDHRPVFWDDVGGLDDIKVQLQQAVEWPLKHGEAFDRLGIRPPSGVLLYGPPGCAKTLLVRAAASACGATFLAISGAQLHSPFVGDAEKKLSEVFRQARAGAPAILFLDEVDAILGKRKEGAGSGGAHERVLSTLLNEMDGIGVRIQDLVRNKTPQREAEGTAGTGTAGQEGGSIVKVDNSSVLVVAATNRPDMVDDALMRPGRLDKVIYVPPPDTKARLEILRVHTKRTPCVDVQLDKLAEATEGFSGADLENLCREAALHALSVDGLDATAVNQKHFDDILRVLKPSLTSDQLTKYAQYKKRGNQPQVEEPQGFDFSTAQPLKKDFNFSKVTT